MASPLSAAGCAALGLFYWAVLGLCLTRRLFPGTLALPLAPAIGWAVHAAATLPLFLAMPFTRTGVAAAALLILAAAVVASRLSARPDRPVAPARVPAWAWAAAALLALAPAAAILPKPAGDAVFLAAPIFDHAKVAMIDDIATFGIPAGNPFFGEAGAVSRLVYYYLWHFSAAQLAVTTGAGGWNADVGLTWSTAFASMAVMMGLAVWLSGRAGAAILAVALSAAGSARIPLWWLFGAGIEDRVIGRADGFAGWLFQAAWVPQHIAAATCAAVSTVLMVRLSQRVTVLAIATLALVIAAGFGSSTWIGGVTFAVAAPAVTVTLMRASGRRRSVAFMAALAVAGVAVLGLTAPFLRDQLAVAAARGGGAPIAFAPYPVLGDDFPERLRAVLDLPAFWLVLLPIAVPAIYPAGAVAITTLIGRAWAPERWRAAAAVAALTGASLAVAWLLSSTLADNNDLGWRAVLVGVMGLTVFAAAGLARWIASGRRVGVMAAAAAVAVGVPGGFELVRSDIAGYAQPDAAVFAATPELWAAVRRQAEPDERVADNPLFMGRMTPWPVNISWALLARRRSCYAGRELTLVYTTLPPQRREAIDAQFIRVFAGAAAPGDIADLATRYDCRVAVVSAADGAWDNDPFATSPFYRLVDVNPQRWRIYRATAAIPGSPPVLVP